MRGFDGNKIWCHLSLKSNDKHTNREIRLSEPAKIGSFMELVPFVARIANHNPDFSLFYRGQPKEYLLKSGATSSYPSIFRSPGNRLTESKLKSRFKLLDDLSKQLINKLETLEIEGIDKLKKFQELQWSLLQHYKVCDTPLLDITHSLRVAASFALNGSSKDGIIYIYALPHPQGTITYSTEDELLNVRLLSASPFEALRPHFQEGYLVGTFPKRIDRKQSSHDVAVRLIAKIQINIHTFWDNNFKAIPEDALYPANDRIHDACKDLKTKNGL
ncbi:MAG: FRG domain-containing protein [Deltaproteobacteria bacterium]|nr:FRG domain-containing protein [Deltaproteobacteria bacterium]